MKWELPVFSEEIDEVFPEDLEDIMTRAGDNRALIILDVRQPREYQMEHLPGAILIPLPELPDRAKELPRDASIVVYCGSGKRSSVAARILKGNGFRSVKNLVGGIGAWSGPRAFGEVDSWQKVLKGTESPDELIKIAYLMEHNLEGFYISLASENEYSEDLKIIFVRLAGFEKSHKEKLARLYAEMTGASISSTGISNFPSDMVEGGLRASEIITGLGLSADRPGEL